MISMTHKALYVAVPVLLGVGIGSAVILGAGPERREATIPAGTAIIAALERPVSTEHNRVGDAVVLRTVQPVSLPDGGAIAPGAIVHGEVTHARGGGRIAGAPELTLRFTALAIDGETYALSTEPFRIRGENDAGESAATIGGGAVAGGLVGGLLGGGDDILKGAVAGAAIGTGVAVATKGDQIVLPTGARLRIRLTESMTVRYRPTAEEHTGSTP
jgi:hypothetical protein